LHAGVPECPQRAGVAMATVTFTGATIFRRQHTDHVRTYLELPGSSFPIWNHLRHAVVAHIYGECKPPKPQAIEGNVYPACPKTPNGRVIRRQHTAITYVTRAAGKQLPLYGITFGTQSSPLWGIRPSRPQAIHGATLTQRAQIQQMTEATVSGGMTSVQNPR
jgi:hypothetical protein